MSLDKIKKYFAGLSQEKRLEQAVELLRQAALPVESLDLCLFPCSGNLNNSFMTYFLGNPDVREAVKNLILCGRIQEEPRATGSSQVPKISIPATKMWKNSLRVLVQTMDVDERVQLVEYDDQQSLEQQLRGQIGGLRSTNTLLIHLPRYGFHMPLTIFDQEKLFRNHELILGTNWNNLEEIGQYLNDSTRRKIMSHELTIDSINRIIKKFKKDYCTTFQSGGEVDLFENIISIRDIYVAVAKEFLKIEPENLQKFENSGLDTAGNILGTMEFGRLLRRIQFEGRILNITNPLDTISYVLCATSGLSPERVLGFRHNDIERCKAFLKDSITDGDLDLETLIGLHHRGWLIDDTILPYNVQNEAANVWISRHVKATFSWNANNDTAISMILLLANMFRRSEELAGISWYHKSKEDNGFGAYLSGCVRLEKEKLFPSTQDPNLTVSDVCEKLEKAGKEELSKGIKCEEKFLEKLCTEGLLEHYERLSEETIKMRQQHDIRVSSRMDGNPFFILGFKGNEAFVYDDKGNKSGTLENIGAVHQITQRGKFLYVLASTGVRNAGLTYTIEKIEPSIDGVKIKDTFQIKKDGRLEQQLRIDPNVNIFGVLLPSEEHLWYRSSENPTTSNIQQVPTSEGAISITQGVISDSSGKVYFLGYGLTGSGENAIYMREFQKSSKVWSGLEKVCDCKVDEMKVEDGNVLIRCDNTVLLYSWIDGTWKPVKKIDKVEVLSDVRALDKELYIIKDETVFSTDHEPVYIAENSIIDVCIAGDKMGIVDNSKFTVYDLIHKKEIHNLKLSDKVSKAHIIQK